MIDYNPYILLILKQKKNTTTELNKNKQDWGHNENRFELSLWPKSEEEKYVKWWKKQIKNNQKIKN